jgi:hypothetical protein
MKRADRCPHCGAPIASSWASLRAMAVSAVCGAVLISICIPVILITVRWAKDKANRSTDRMVWHEPLDSWNR